MTEHDLPEAHPSERVQKFILDKISSRFWPANSKIMTEHELGELLGVSRVAVREAIGRLVALGLLTKRQGAGTFVADPNPDSCFDFLFPMILLDGASVHLLLEFRCQFECGNVRLFMAHHKPSDIEALRCNFDKMLAARDGDPGLSSSLDYEFHQIIAMGTANPFVIRISSILNGIMQSHQKLLYQSGDPDNPYEYHRDIIKYIAKGDAEVAVSLMRRHIEISIESFNREKT